MSGPIPDLDALTGSMILTLLSIGLYDNREIARALDVSEATVAKIARDEKGVLRAMYAGFWRKRLGERA